MLAASFGFKVSSEVASSRFISTSSSFISILGSSKALSMQNSFSLAVGTLNSDSAELLFLIKHFLQPFLLCASKYFFFLNFCPQMDINGSLACCFLPRFSIFTCSVFSPFLCHQGSLSLFQLKGHPGSSK